MSTLAYVVNLADNDVAVIDISTNTVTGTITVGTSPIAAVITPNVDFVYVANGLSFDVSVIDTSNESVIKTIPVGRFPLDIAISPGGAFAYVTNFGDNNVSVIDTNTNTVVDTFPVGEAPVGIAIINIAQQVSNFSLTITKADFPDPVKLGEGLIYTIQVTNNGPDTAPEVILTDTLPQEADFISVFSDQVTCRESNGVVTCELGNMDINDTAAVIRTVNPGPQVLFAIKQPFQRVDQVLLHSSTLHFNVQLFWRVYALKQKEFLIPAPLKKKGKKFSGCHV